MLVVRDPNHRNQLIELRDVMTYAFAEYEDGSYGFWAGGKGGWYEFESAATSYNEILVQMSEATSFFYNIADKLRRARKPKARLTAKQLEEFIRRFCSDVSDAIVVPSDLCNMPRLMLRSFLRKVEIQQSSQMSMMSEQHFMNIETF